jgi:hypothetical protein
MIISWHSPGITEGNIILKVHYRAKPNTYKVLASVNHETNQNMQRAALKTTP